MLVFKILKIHFLSLDKPVIETSGAHAKAAGSEGDDVRIICRATGAPNVTFTWLRDGTTIQDGKRPPKYEIKSKQVDFITYESILTVNDLKTQDYGDYECVGKNELGFESYKIPLGQKCKYLF